MFPLHVRPSLLPRVLEESSEETGSSARGNTSVAHTCGVESAGTEGVMFGGALDTLRSLKPMKPPERS